MPVHESCTVMPKSCARMTQVWWLHDAHRSIYIPVIHAHRLLSPPPLRRLSLSYGIVCSRASTISPPSADKHAHINAHIHAHAHMNVLIHVHTPAPAMHLPRRARAHRTTAQRCTAPQPLLTRASGPSPSNIRMWSASDQTAASKWRGTC